MYMVAGWNRLDEASWLDGEMIFVALTNRTFGRIDVNWLPYRGLLHAVSLGPLVLEAIAPIALWLPRVGPLVALGLMAMHLGIELTANVGWWQLMMMTVLTTFLPTAWLAAAHGSLLDEPSVSDQPGV